MQSSRRIDQDVGNQVSKLSDSLTALTGLLGTFQTQSSQFTASSVAPDGLQAQIEGLQTDVNNQISLSIRGKIGEILHAEVKQQVKLEVDEQMRDYSLDRLHAEIEDSKKRVNEARVSLDNSRARLQNSNIRSEYVEDSLAVVLTPEGKRSDMYPSTLGALLEYDSDDIRALIRDFGLVEAETDETNLNQFLAHIGTRAKVAGQV
ncbi:hypothetical protein BJ165DRAFT_960873 [Panaeolus papilionaceus]|nr:hypothetical protein BJ165DRAFT_960873 [Panaeolus papilionaceus]